MNSCTVVMYHYVRDLKKSRYPNIKGLHIELFKQQLEYMKRYYTFVTIQDLIASVDCGEPLPNNATLLTFDDGYIDHFQYVFPILEREKIEGCFFPSARAVSEGKLLDVNKIHYILAAQPDYHRIKDTMLDYIKEYQDQYRLEAIEGYLTKYERPDRFDPGEVIFIKAMLQHGLPEELRSHLCDALFKKFVSVDETTFARELYMDTDQLACMHRCGMYIGSHGYSHYWMSQLSGEVQSSEIDKALKVLAEVGADTSSWVMCYPYGDYNENLINMIKGKGCKLAFTTVFDIAQMDPACRYKLPRLDTNDLPKEAGAKPNAWTKKVTR